MTRRQISSLETPGNILHRVGSVLLCAVLVGSCGNEETRAEVGMEAGTVRQIEQLPRRFFEIVGEITLEESDEVITVSPKTSLDAAGDILIADGREAQIRIYRTDGSLVTHFGRRGSGPGEFSMPQRAHRLPSGALMVADIVRGLAIFDSLGTAYVEATYPPVSPLYTALPLSDSLVLVAGRQTPTEGRDERPSLLFVWNRITRTVVHRFFPTPGDTTILRAAGNFGWANMAVRGDTVAALFAMTDTLFFFNTAGVALGRIPLPMERFLRMESFVVTNDPVKRTEWLGGLHFLESVHWLADGTLLVQYERPERLGSEWHLLWITRDGRRLFDLHDTPRLLTVQADRLYFLRPDSETPDRWLIARLHDSR